MSTTTEETPAMSDDEKQAQQDANRDPLSGRAGAHPVGTGLGAATGGALVGIATGAMMGAVGGPPGMAVGAILGATVGAVGGGLAGKALAEQVNPTAEHGFWKGEYAMRPYAIMGMAYDEYAPAYQFGWESEGHHADKSFEQTEPMMQREWDKVKGNSKLAWKDAKEAVHDAWKRIAKRRQE